VAVRRVVVGVDGSPEADDALVWALREAWLRDVPLHAVNVWQPSGRPQEAERLAELQSVADLRAGLLRQVSAGVLAVAERARATGVAVTSDVLYGSPARELIRAAGADSLLVVGSRGRGSVTGVVLGSVSQSCAQYAAGTVVVVRGRRPDPAAGRVVVGVDGSSRSVQALRFAADAARCRGASLQVVHAWTLPYLGFAGPSETLPQETVDELAADASETLHESLRRGSVDTSRSDVLLHLVESAPAVALLKAAEGADLLVVGSRGHGGWKGLLMGSVSLRCITQSPCPVAVFREPDDNGE